LELPVALLGYKMVLGAKAATNIPNPYEET